MTQEMQWLLQEKFHGTLCDAFYADCSRLHAGEPLAYIIGYVPFLHTRIYLDSRPLIPRPETEFWVQAVITKIGAGESTRLKALDLCAGSGCIGTALLHSFPYIHVDFVEIDTSHHPTILKNAQAYSTDDSRFHIYGGDLFSDITEKYDYILSNPPYIDPALDRAEPSVKEHEPTIALYGGDKGLEYITRILAHAHDFLTENGTLVIEHEPEHTSSLVSLSTTYNLDPITHHDQYGVLRFTTFTRKVL